MAERRIKISQKLIDALGDDRCTRLAETIMFAEQFEEVDELMYMRITELMCDIAEQYTLDPDEMDTFARTITSCHISGIS